MSNEYVMGCPECSMSYGMHAPLSKKDGTLLCTNNPTHKFTRDNNGFLKSIL